MESIRSSSVMFGSGWLFDSFGGEGKVDGGLGGYSCWQQSLTEGVMSAKPHPASLHLCPS